MKKFFIVLSLVALTILSGCFGSTPTSPNHNPAKGSLTLMLASDLTPRTIQPDLDMTIAKYDISGSGPIGANFTRKDVTGTSLEVDVLAAGDWQIVAEAKNADNIIIAAGTTTVTVTGGENATAHVTVRPLNGTGTLNIGMSWPASTIVKPIINATLTPKGGTAKSLSFNISGDKLSASFEDMALQAGYYTLIVALYDDTFLRWGAVEAVRIIAGQTSNGNYPIIPPPAGTINLIIEPDLQNPIDVTFADTPQYIPLGGSLTVSVHTSQAVDSYQWYIDSILIEGATSDTVTIGSDLKKGPHRLDLVVTKGNVISSGTLNFTVGAPPVSSARPTSTQVVTPTPKPVPTSTLTPTPTTSEPKVISITGAEFHTLALKSDGTVLAWGSNGHGELGIGSTSNSIVPVKINSLTDVVEISAGKSHNMALKSDGTVWTWGFNAFGQIGNGSTNDISTPIKVSSLSGITQISAGLLYSLALKNDGTVWAWGHNQFGQLGVTNLSNSITPVKVNLLPNVIAIAAGQYHNFALINENTLCAWGYNAYGQLGINNTSDWQTPISGVKTIGAIGCSSFAIKTDNTPWVWGNNDYGQLGNSITNNILVPIAFGSLTNVNSIATNVGACHTLILLNNGTVWACGWNSYGQLGIGPSPSISSHLVHQISSLSNVKFIGSGIKSGFAVKNDDTVWAWGYNNFGQLGDGTTTTRYYPVQVNL